MTQTLNALHRNVRREDHLTVIPHRRRRWIGRDEEREKEDRLQVRRPEHVRDPPRVADKRRAREQTIVGGEKREHERHPVHPVGTAVNTFSNLVGAAVVARREGDPIHAVPSPAAAGQ